MFITHSSSFKLKSNSIDVNNELNPQNKYNALYLAQQSTQDKINLPMINRNLMYPIHNEPINYGSLPPSMYNCECTRYLQAP